MSGDGCRTCGGYGMRHDPVQHGWISEDDLAPWPSPEEQAVIDRFGIFAEEEGR